MTVGAARSANAGALEYLCPSEYFTGKPVPDDEPFEVTRAHASL